MKRFSAWLTKVSKGWVSLGALVIFVLFMILVMPRQAAQGDTAAQTAGTPDLSLYYSVEDLYRMAEAYGPQGRIEYVRVRFTFDVVWPLVYTLFLCTAISWLFSKAFASDSRWQLANLVPVLGAIFDFLENLSTSLIMLRYPDRTAVVDWLAPLFTLVKWILVGGGFVLLLFGIGAAIWQWNRQRNSVRGE